MRIVKSIPVLLTILVLVGGCFVLPGGIVCTEQFVYGVNVSVSDENGDAVTGATLTLTDGDYTETMDEISDGEYVGAGERAGTYSLTVEAAGFESVTIDDIEVNADECHVLPESREVELTPFEGNS